MRDGCSDVRPWLAYTRDQLLSVYSAARPAVPVVDCLRSFGLLTVCRLRGLSRGRTVRPTLCDDDPLLLSCYRGCRSGQSRRQRPTPVLLSAGNGAAVIVGNRPSPPIAVPRPSPGPSLLRVHIDRHSASPGCDLVFGCLNIQSVANKLDDLLEVRLDQQIDVLCLVETWHDGDSVSLRRLRADGYQVVDCPRPRHRVDTLATNHGGVAAVAVAGVRLTRLDIGAKPATFELLCVRVTSGSASMVVAIVYRPGSAAVTSAFFGELADVLDRLATLAEPVQLVGDINIHLERPADHATCEFTDVLAVHGLVACASGATHDSGGTLDVVVARDDLPLPRIDVLDVGLSDHRLLRWTAPLSRPPPVYIHTTGRPWARLDKPAFRTALLASALCRPEQWSMLDVDRLASMYDTEIAAILDRQLPVRSVQCRCRTPSPWFDDDCRVSRRRVRQLEREARRADPADAAASAAVWTARRREYRAMVRLKRESYWQEKVDVQCSSPRQLWRSVDQLLGRGHSQEPPAVAADVLHRFFDDKVAGVRAATADAAPPTFAAVPLGCSLTAFRPLTVADVIAGVRALPDKQCASDPLPTHMLKDNVDVLAPFLVDLFNRSMALGVVPAVFKAAYITPLLKKADLDPTDAKSYRPISNLSVLSKLLERLVARQLLDYLTASRLLPDLQSAYRAYHSTETAVLKVLADILRAVDTGDLALLTLLDLSAAFDTVDHDTLLRRLSVSYGLDGGVHRWFRSYLSGRTQFIRSGLSRSALAAVLFGVPQGSVLGPILFILYTADLLRLIESHGLHPHLYADDTQISGSCRPDSTAQLQARVSACVRDVAAWMRSNRLQLNAAKTEALWCASARRQHQIPVTPLTVSLDTVMPVRSVRDLGIYLDSDLSMRTHVLRTAAGCFAILRQLYSIRRCVSKRVLQSLVVSLVLTRLDYGCATLAGCPSCLLDKLQSVMNAAARLVCSARKYDHVTPLLRELHWLRVPERITFRLAVYAYRCQHGLAPPYLAADIHRVADVESRRHLRSASTAELLVPSTHHVTIGDRAFPVAAARAWNSLPPRVTSSPSLQVFRRQLKTELFARSFSAL